MTNTEQHEYKDRLRSVYLQTAFHYYITARFATINALGPVAGHLAHHAIGMFLRAAITRQGGLSRRVLLLRGRELRAMYPSCR